MYSADHVIGTIHPEATPQRQSHESGACVIGDAQLAEYAPVLHSCGRTVQRNIVEDRVHTAGLQRLDELTAEIGLRQQEVIQMTAVGVVRRHDGAPDEPVALEVGERIVIVRPQRPALSGHIIQMFQLRPEECGSNLAEQV